jgi:hypothetical protein
MWGRGATLKKGAGLKKDIQYRSQSKGIEAYSPDARHYVNEKGFSRK